MSAEWLGVFLKAGFFKDDNKDIDTEKNDGTHGSFEATISDK